MEARKGGDPDGDRRRDALVWLLAVGVTLTPRIRRVLAGLYVDAYTIGDRAAQMLLRDIETVGWGNWAPGDAAVSPLLAGGGAAPALDQLINEAEQVAAGINNTRLVGVADRLSASVGSGETVDELDAGLRGVLGDESAADLVASTETARAMGAGALDRYTITPGITHYAWVTSGGHVCALCMRNAAASPLPLGVGFPSGGTPPAHPACRCALLPILP